MSQKKKIFNKTIYLKWGFVKKIIAVFTAIQINGLSFIAAVESAVYSSQTTFIQVSPCRRLPEARVRPSEASALCHIISQSSILLLKDHASLWSTLLSSFSRNWKSGQRTLCCLQQCGWQDSSIPSPSSLLSCSPWPEKMNGHWTRCVFQWKWPRKTMRI